MLLLFIPSLDLKVNPTDAICAWCVFLSLEGQIFQFNFSVSYNRLGLEDFLEIKLIIITKI